MEHPTPIPLLRCAGLPFFLASMLLLATPACISTQTASTMSEALDSLDISNRGARDANIRVAYRYGLAVEQAADSILLLATDQRVKVNAYLWKIYCIPVIRQIYSQSDPVVSAFDGLAFAVQCREYFATGMGRDRFGGLQHIAVDAAETIERRLVETTRGYLTEANSDSVIAATSRWARNHPLTNHVFERASIFTEMDRVLDRQSHTVGSTVGRIADVVDDLSGRLSLLAAQLPREARWQGEYLLTDLAPEDRLARLDTLMAVLTSTLGSLDKEVRTGGLVVDIASLQGLHADLRAALELLSAERAVVIADIERMRVATIATAEETARRGVAGLMDRAEAILDRTLWKIGTFLAVGFAAVALLLLFARGRSRRLSGSNEGR
jgi:hypothetical protein